jgi:hypothetical protein
MGYPSAYKPSLKGVDKMARKREKQVIIRMSEEEYQMYEALRNKSGLNKTQYGLKCLLKKDIVVLDGFKELTEQIKKVGININQIAKGVNSGMGISKDKIELIQKELGEVWQSLSVFLRKVK